MFNIRHTIILSLVASFGLLTGCKSTNSSVKAAPDGLADDINIEPGNSSQYPTALNDLLGIGFALTEGSDVFATFENDATFTCVSSDCRGSAISFGPLERLRLQKFRKENLRAAVSLKNLVGDAKEPNCPTATQGIAFWVRLADGSGWTAIGLSGGCQNFRRPAQDPEFGYANYIYEVLNAVLQGTPVTDAPRIPSELANLPANVDSALTSGPNVIAKLVGATFECSGCSPFVFSPVDQARMRSARLTLTTPVAVDQLVIAGPAITNCPQASHGTVYWTRLLNGAGWTAVGQSSGCQTWERPTTDVDHDAAKQLASLLEYWFSLSLHQH